MSKQKILVWDIPTRLFHWLLAASFATAYLTSEEEAWQSVHVTAGYTLMGLVCFRIVWGFIGSRYARFGSFWFKPADILAYRQSLRGQPQHFIGHNPLGSVAIYLLLGLGLLTTVIGHFMYGAGTEDLKEVHEFFANAMILVIIGHIGGVILSSRKHGENLTRAMVTGLKDGNSEQGITSKHVGIGALLLATVVTFWIYTTLHPFEEKDFEKGEHAEHQQNGKPQDD